MFWTIVAAVVFVILAAAAAGDLRRRWIDGRRPEVGRRATLGAQQARAHDSSRGGGHWGDSAFYR